MTDPVYFTVVADFKAFIEDASTDSDYDPQVVPVGATVTFTPVLNTGDVVLATGASPRPIGYIPSPVVAVIDPADGRLKIRTTADAGATGGYGFAPVRLLGNSDLLELASPLFYSVRFSDVTWSNGRRGSITGFTFEAPNSDTVLNLITVARQPGVAPSGLTKIAPGGVRLEDGNIIFSFASVDIPEEIPFTPIFTSDEITDLTATGQAVITAVDAGAARTAIGAENAAMKGASGGYAPLDSTAKIDAAYLPSYVDDVLSYANQASFPATGETGKIYVAQDTGDAFRWTGSAYLRISDRVTAAGITDSTSTGRALVTATDAAAARTAVGATATGSSLVTATDALAARTAIDAARAGGTIFVEDYRDGVRTDTEIITAAFAALADGGEVRFGPGVTYTTTADFLVTIGPKSDILVNGQGAIIDGYLSFRGNRYGTTNTTLTSAITARTDTLTVASTTGWAAGEMMRLFSNNELWTPGYSTTGTSRKSEMARVQAIPNSTTITLDARTWDTYSITGNTVTCQRYEPMKNLTIRDLTLVGNYADDDLVGLDIRYFDGLRLEGVVAKGFSDVAIKLVEGISVIGIGCRAEDTMGASNGYGFSCVDVLNARWIGCYGLRNRHSFDAFLTRDLEVIACAAYHNRSAGFSTHASTDTVKFVNNTARECGGGIITRGRNTMIRGNHVYGTKFSAESSSQTYRSGIVIGQGAAEWDGYSGENLIVDGNIVDLYGPTYGTYPIEGDVNGLTHGIVINESLVGAKIINNTLRNFPTHGIYGLAGTHTSADISGNHIDCSQQVGTYKSGIIFEPWVSDAAHVQTGLVIRNNIISGTNASTHSGIRIAGGSTTSPRSDDLIVANNTISACQTAPIFLGGTYFYAEGLTAPFTDTFIPRTGGYFGSAIYIHDNITDDVVSVSYTGANHTATPYIRNNRHANKAVLAGTTSDTADSGAQFLGALGTGLVKNTTTTGVLSIAAAGTDYVAPGGDLGTPSSGTLTNATGLPVAGITASTSTALGVGSVELGHASDTTVSRSAAGVIAVEGVDVATRTISSVTTSTTLSAVAGRHYIVLLGSGAAPTLATAVGNTSVYTVKNAHTANITVATTSSQTIESQASLTLRAGESATLVSDTANWRII